MVEFPCKDCNSRFLGCHSVCKSYLNAKSMCKSSRVREDSMRFKERIFMDYIANKSSRRS